MGELPGFPAFILKGLTGDCWESIWPKTCAEKIPRWEDFIPRIDSGYIKTPANEIL